MVNVGRRTVAPNGIHGGYRYAEYQIERLCLMRPLLLSGRGTSRSLTRTPPESIDDVHGASRLPPGALSLEHIWAPELPSWGGGT